MVSHHPHFNDAILNGLATQIWSAGSLPAQWEVKPGWIVVQLKVGGKCLLNWTLDQYFGSHMDMGLINVDSNLDDIYHTLGGLVKAVRSFFGAFLAPFLHFSHNHHHFYCAILVGSLQGAWVRMNCANSVNTAASPSWGLLSKLAKLTKYKKVFKGSKILLAFVTCLLKQ